MRLYWGILYFPFLIPHSPVTSPQSTIPVPNPSPRSQSPGPVPVAIQLVCSLRQGNNASIGLTYNLVLNGALYCSTVGLVLSYFPRGQIENTRGQNKGIQDDDITSFKSSDLNQLIKYNYHFCRRLGREERIIYYTSGQEDKEHLDGVMERVRKYLDFNCRNDPNIPGR